MTLARARSRALDLAPVLGFALLTALAAQVSVHAWPVPFTLQTTAVLASGLILGARRGALAQASMLGMAACDAPVLAEGRFGPFWAFPTGGYLLAFVVAAGLAGWAAERWRGWRLGLAVGVANLALLTLGTLWLSVWLGHAAWMEGFVPFLPGALAQSLAAWAVAGAFRRLDGA